MEEELEEKKRALREEMGRIEHSDERMVDEEALKEARAALEDLVNRMREKFDSWYEQTDAIAENVSHMKSEDEVRAYFESLLDGSEEIERLMLYQYSDQVEMKKLIELKVAVDVGRQPFTSREGEVTIDPGEPDETGFGRMQQGSASASVTQQLDIPRFASLERPIGKILVRFQRNRFLQNLIETEPPFGAGFGMWGTGLPEQGVTAFPDVARKLYIEIHMREGTEVVWPEELTVSETGYPILLVGHVPGWNKEAAILLTKDDWTMSYSFEGTVAFLMPADVIYNTEWKEKELADLAAMVKNTQKDLIERRKELEARGVAAGAEAEKRFRILALQVFFVWAAFLFFWLIIPAFVYADAAKLGLPAGLWALLTVVTGVLGALIYLLVRPRNRVVCHECGGAIEESFVVCPGCGAELKASCPSCGKTVAPEWKVCPYCRGELSPESLSPGT
jgi:hypothetical protein